MFSRKTIGSGCAAVCCMIACVLVVAGCGRKPATREPSPETTNGQPIQRAAAAPVYVDIAEQSGLNFVHVVRSGSADGAIANILDSDGAGGAILDFDGDGLMDVYLANSGVPQSLSDNPMERSRRSNRLYRNLGNGRFEDVTEKAGVSGHGFGVTAAAADYDNDGDTDLFVVNFDGYILYENLGNGTFRDVTERAGITAKKTGISATFFDMDNDGYLDLLVANYLVFDPAIKPPPGSGVPYAGPLFYQAELNILYRNNGDGTFRDVSEQAGILVPGHRAMSVAALDFDLDGDTDLYVSNDGTPNLLFVNDGKGKFKEEGFLRGVAYNQFGAAEGSMAATVGDCNGDGLPDMFVTRFGVPSLYVNGPGCVFEDRGAAAGVGKLTSGLTSWGGNFVDFDNDGVLDLFIANGDAHFVKGMRPLLLQNDGRASFKDAAAIAGPFFSQMVNARGSGLVDFDNDGRLDIVICTLGGPVALLHNRAQTQNHWLKLRLEGTRSNLDGFGALVRVHAGGRTLAAECRCPTTYVFQSDPRLHFGLGPNPKVERIEIRWPSGQTQVLTDVQPDTILRVREPGESQHNAASTEPRIKNTDIELRTVGGERP
ncbi:MAG: CRTAC1 family protein [Verrucomicrobiota bacterium]|nr:CRTAC1 family protein [Verrucomicrobiota bacterium]